LTPDAIASILSLSEFKSEKVERDSLTAFGVSSLFGSQRILVGKTPNLTPAVVIA